MKCGYCGEENKEDSLYCMACGSRISEGQAGLDLAEGQGQTLAFPQTGRDQQAPSPNYSGFVFGNPPHTPPAIDSVIQTESRGAEAPSPAPDGISIVREVGVPSTIMEKPDYLMPPETDYPPDSVKKEVSSSAVPQTAESASASSKAAAVDSTQVIAPISPQSEAAKRRVICPECYAANTEQNRYCQECGNPLALRSSRPAASQRTSAAAATSQHTTVLPVEMVQQAVAEPATGRSAKAERARSDRSFGVTDALALLGILSAGIALSPIFTWKKGLTIGIFSHQGAFSQGRVDLLGGPGLLPYAGAEFFTVGFIVAVGLGLAVLFLALRVGRGPMLILAGSLLLFPLAYMLFQGILPLREAGVNIQSAIGLNAILFGNTSNAGSGPALWLISGGGLLLLLAGFLAPPRGWGRLFTFMLFFSLIVGAAFFCAAAYNWNILINKQALSVPGAVVKALSFLRF